MLEVAASQSEVKHSNPPPPPGGGGRAWAEERRPCEPSARVGRPGGGAAMAPGPARGLGSPGCLRAAGAGAEAEAGGGGGVGGGGRWAVGGGRGRGRS